MAVSKLGIGKKTLIKKLEKIRELLRAGDGGSFERSKKAS
jgi:hypothetical protein